MYNMHVHNILDVDYNSWYYLDHMLRFSIARYPGSPASHSIMTRCRILPPYRSEIRDLSTSTLLTLPAAFKEYVSDCGCGLEPEADLCEGDERPCPSCLNSFTVKWAQL
jgi:hypothetical protein